MECRGSGKPPGGDAIFDEVAKQIRTVLRRTGLVRTLAIGALVLERFFGGSVIEWRAKRNRKNNSVRRLAERPDCPLSRSSLNRAIGIYAVTKTVPVVLKLRNIEAGHIGVLLPLPTKDQEQWLVRADAQHWSVRQLRDAVLHERRERGERRGRPKASRWQTALSVSRGSLARLEATIASLSELEPDHESSRVLSELQGRLAALQNRLARVPAVERPSSRDSQVWRIEPVPKPESDETEPKRAVS